MVVEALPVPLSLSVAERVTTYVPLSSGVKLKEVPAPEAKAEAFLVTLQAKAKPALVSAELGSVALPVRAMAVPSGLEAGAPPIVGVGATLFTVTTVVYSVNPPSLSMIRAFTVLVAGPSSNVQLVEALAPLPAYVAPERSALVQL